MKSCELFELSAHLDGELDARRAKEIEVLLANDPVLRSEYDQMKVQDALWASAARSAIARPHVRIEATESRSRFVVRSALLVTGLLAVRLVPKIFELMGIGILLHLIVLTMALAWVVRSEE